MLKCKDLITNQDSYELKLIILFIYYTKGNKEYLVIAGNREWMHRHGLTLSPEMEKTLVNEENLGRTAVMCAVDGI